MGFMSSCFFSLIYLNYHVVHLIAAYHCPFYISWFYHHNYVKVDLSIILAREDVEVAWGDFVIKFAFYERCTMYCMIMVYWYCKMFDKHTWAMYMCAKFLNKCITQQSQLSIKNIDSCVFFIHNEFCVIGQVSWSCLKDLFVVTIKYLRGGHDHILVTLALYW